MRIIRPALAEDVDTNAIMWHQNEPDIKDGLHYWGAVSSLDKVHQIHREIACGSSLWWVDIET